MAEGGAAAVIVGAAPPMLPRKPAVRAQPVTRRLRRYCVPGRASPRKEECPVSSSKRRLALLAAAAVASACVVALALPATRHLLVERMPPDLLVQLNGLRFGYRVDRDVRLRMPDGTELAASVYLPRKQDAKLATILVRVPYNRRAYPPSLNAAERFARAGYAVVLEDLRGTGDSQGRLLPYESAITDGSATLDWIAAQPWSNGRVGTWGCSALGETQYVLSRSHHPALRAIAPSGAGGAIGSAAGRYSYFGVYEGGIFQLASGFGWFVDYGASDPHAAPMPPLDIPSAIAGLPVAGLVQRHRPGPNGYDEFMRLGLTDPHWHELGYLDDTDVPSQPTFELNTWGDQSVGDTLAFDESLRRRAPSGAAALPERHLVIGPGNHCHVKEAGSGDVEMFGELPVRHGDPEAFELSLRWFDHWLRDSGDGLAALPPLRYFMLVEDRWLDATRWPPAEAVPQRWYLDGAGRANGVGGDGLLVPDAPARAAADAFDYDPQHPVPSRGGPMCCTGNPDDHAGPASQKDVEARADVLVYTSPVLQAPLRIAGPLHAVLTVSSSALDTDFVARLVDVAPDGSTLSIQEGALRARYREGIDRPKPLPPGEPVALTIDMRSIAWRVAAGHRLRLDVTSSSFPRLERNLNTGGDNARETTIVVARNRVLHGGATPSYVELALLPADAPNKP
jgi:predicted acyl esterase